MSWTEFMTLVCPDCFGNSGLQRRIVEIRPNFDEGNCDFHPSKKGVPIADVAAIVDEVFRNRYTFSSIDPRTGEYNGYDLEGTLWDLTEAEDDDVIRALSDELIELDDYWPPDGGEPFYSDEAGYEVNDFGYEEHSNTWQFFRREILHEQRFFNVKALEKLKEIFDGLHLLRDDANLPAVYEIKPSDPEARIFRARISNGMDGRQRIAENPSQELGPPPENLRRAGRMNSSGILAFYGAFDFNTCVAELRPAVGETVVSAEFGLVRPILVLDTTRFSGRPKDINIFAKTHMKRMRLWKFMSTFMNEIAQPCLPNDEHLDYVPTQVVSEYLRHLHKFKRGDGDKTIDAIIYRSAQNGVGKNIAIFGDAGSVEGGSNTSEWTWSRTQHGLQFIEGTVETHVVNGVSHNTEEAFTPVRGSKRSKFEEDF